MFLSLFECWRSIDSVCLLLCGDTPLHLPVILPPLPEQMKSYK